MSSVHSFRELRTFEMRRFERSRTKQGVGLIHASRYPVLNKIETVLPIHRQHAACLPHSRPVILVRNPASAADLIVLASSADARPGKTMSTSAPEDSFQEAHLTHSYRGSVMLLTAGTLARGVSARFSMFRGVLLSGEGPKCA